MREKSAQSVKGRSCTMELAKSAATGGMNAQGPRSLPQLGQYRMGVSVTSTSKRCDRGAFWTGAIYSNVPLRCLSMAAPEHNTGSP
jgi:hypothetical protein